MPDRIAPTPTGEAAFTERSSSAHFDEPESLVEKSQKLEAAGGAEPTYGHTVHRVAWVDIYKALAITLVVLGHAKSPFNALIYLFHVPAFFFISGYTNDLNKYQFVEFVRRRAKSLLVPYVSVNLLFVAYYALVSHVAALTVLNGGTHLGVKASMVQLFTAGLAPTDLAGATWFLVVLFAASILLKLIWDMAEPVRHRDLVVGVVVVALGAEGFYLHYHMIIWTFMLDLAPTAMLYMYFGYLAKKHSIFQERIRHWIAVPFALAALAYESVFQFGGMDFPSRTFSSPWLVLIGSMSGIYILYHVARLLGFVPNKWPLLYLGRQTLAVLCFHFLAFKAAYSLLYWIGAVPVSQIKTFLPMGQTIDYWPLIAFTGIGVSLALAWFIGRSRVLSQLFLGISMKPSRLREVAA